LDKTTPEELKELTAKSYTAFKSQLIAESQKIQQGEFTLAEYIQRLEYEMKVIHEMGFNTYMLVVQDFINRARAHDIVVGPGRGSAVGSLLSRCVGITDVDPLPYGLLFERFLNPARISQPDIDIDFEDTLRDKVVDYVSAKYGSENVANIGTFMKMTAKAAFKDVARVMGIPFDRANQLSNLLPEKVSLKEMTADLNKYEELARAAEENAVQKTFEYATKLENNVRQL
jgi:DNA polymerase-3 subunit alpha